MQRLAVERAQERLRRATTALLQFERAKSFIEAETAWTDFLLACGSIFSKLEQGAKGNGRSEYWVGLKKRRRKSDPLLLYIHKARNAEEHGLERVTARSVDGGFNLGFGEKREFFIQGLDPITRQPIDDPGYQSAAWACGPHVKLISVYDGRQRKHYDPPYKDVFPAADPAVLGAEALRRLNEIIVDAERLVTDIE